MSRAHALTAALFLANAIPVLAEPSFNGRWRIDPASSPANREIKTWLLRPDGLIIGGKPGGARMPADGTFNPNAEDYCDEMAVTVVSPRAVRQQCRIKGKPAFDMQFELSADLQSLQRTAIITTSPDGSIRRSETRWRRLSGPPKAAHAMSGRWRTIADIIQPSPADDWHITLDGNRFSLRQGDGGGYDSIIDGDPVVVDGDNSGSTSRVIRPAVDAVEELVLDKTGRITARMRLTIAADGKSITGTTRTEDGKRRSSFRLNRVE